MSNPTLFDTPETIVSGRPRNLLPKEGEVFFFANFFSKQESDRLFKDLLEKIIWQQDQIKFYGKVMDIPRLTAWYGDNDKPYTYSGIPMKPHSWTPDLLEIKNKIEKEANVNFSSVLLNRYRTGKDGVAWHCDDEKELGTNPVIGSVSFGATRTFKFRNLADKELVEKVELTHGSFVLMQGETQHKWEHEIPKIVSKTRVIGERINLTFRVIK
jgi:alkylated DNA repair dioxygenase AlkB